MSAFFRAIHAIRHARVCVCVCVACVDACGKQTASMSEHIYIEGDVAMLPPAV